MSVFRRTGDEIADFLAIDNLEQPARRFVRVGLGVVAMAAGGSAGLQVPEMIIDPNIASGSEVSALSIAASGIIAYASLALSHALRGEPYHINR